MRRNFMRGAQGSPAAVDREAEMKFFIFQEMRNEKKRRPRPRLGVPPATAWRFRRARGASRLDLCHACATETKVAERVAAWTAFGSRGCDGTKARPGAARQAKGA